MTIVLAILVEPKNNQKPFVIFGSDSLQVKCQIEGSTKKEIGKDENQQKIFEIHNFLIAFTGNVQSGFISEIIKFLAENSSKENDISTLLEIAKGYVMSRIKESSTEEITITIGTLDTDGKPILKYWKVIKANETIDEPLSLETSNEKPFRFLTAGVEVPDDLMDSLENDIKHEDDFDTVMKNAKKFLGNVAKRYPDVCNQNIKLKAVR